MEEDGCYVWGDGRTTGTGPALNSSTIMGANTAATHTQQLNRWNVKDDNHDDDGGEGPLHGPDHHH